MPVKEVRISKRLTESPALSCCGDYDMSANLQRCSNSWVRMPRKPNLFLEVNPVHPLVEKMDQEPDEGCFC